MPQSGQIYYWQRRMLSFPGSIPYHITQQKMSDEPFLSSSSVLSTTWTILPLPWRGKLSSGLPPWPHELDLSCRMPRVASWYLDFDQPSAQLEAQELTPWTEQELIGVATHLASRTQNPGDRQGVERYSVAFARHDEIPHVLIWDGCLRLLVSGLTLAQIDILIRQWVDVADCPSGQLWSQLDTIAGETIELAVQAASACGPENAIADATTLTAEPVIPTTEQRQSVVLAMQLPPFQVPEFVLQRLQTMSWSEAEFRRASRDLFIPSSVLKFTAVRLGLLTPNDSGELRNIQIVDCYARGMTLDEIAQSHGISRERIRQICNAWHWPTRTEIRNISKAEHQRSIVQVILRQWEYFIRAWQDNVSIEEMSSVLQLEQCDLTWAIATLDLKRDQLIKNARQKEENQHVEQILRLREAIKRRGITISGLSKAIGRNELYLSMCMSRKVMPIAHLSDLARILAVPESWLLSGIGSPAWGEEIELTISGNKPSPVSVVEDEEDNVVDHEVDIGDYPSDDSSPGNTPATSSSGSGLISVQPLPIASVGSTLVFPGDAITIFGSGAFLSVAVDGEIRRLAPGQSQIVVDLPALGEVRQVLLRMDGRRRPWQYDVRRGEIPILAERQIAVLSSPTQEIPIFIGSSQIIPSEYLTFTKLISRDPDVGYRTKRACRALNDELSEARLVRLIDDGRALTLTIDDVAVAWLRADDRWFIDRLSVSCEQISGTIVAAGKRPLTVTVIDLGGDRPLVADWPILARDGVFRIELPDSLHPGRFIALHDGERLLMSLNREECIGLWVEGKEAGADRIACAAITQSHASAKAAADLISVCAVLRWLHGMATGQGQDHHTQCWSALSASLSNWLTKTMRGHPHVTNKAMLIMPMEQATVALERMPILRLAYLTINPSVEVPHLFTGSLVPSWSIFLADYQHSLLARSLSFVSTAAELDAAVTSRLVEIHRFRQKPEADAIAASLSALGDQEDGSLDDLARGWLIAIRQGLPSVVDDHALWESLPVPSLTRELRGKKHWNDWDLRCLQLAELCWSGDQNPASPQLFSSHYRASPVHQHNPMHRLWRFYVHVLGSLRSGVAR